MAASEISYFDNKDLMLPQFGPGSNNSNNHSEHFSDNTKMRIFFCKQILKKKDDAS